DLACTLRRTCGEQDLFEWHARPPRLRDGADAPLHTLGSRLELLPPVAGALERHRLGLRRARTQVVERQTRRRLDRTVDLDAPRRCVDFGNIEVVTDEVQVCGHVRQPERIERSGPDLGARREL